MVDGRVKFLRLSDERLHALFVSIPRLLTRNVRFAERMYIFTNS